MKNSIFLVVNLLPVLCYSQIADTNKHLTDSIPQQRLITTSPKLGGITLTNLIAPIKVDGHTFTLQQPVLDIGMPVYKKFKTKHPILIKLGVRYQGMLFSNEPKIGSSNFHSATIPFIANYSISRARNITFVSLTTIGSDFKSDVQAEDVLYTFGVRMGFRQAKSFKYGITLTYSHNYSGNFLIPIPDFDWSISRRLSLSGVLPARVSFKYKISENQSLGITEALNSGMYSLNSSGIKKQYLQFQQLSGGLIYNLDLGANLKLNITGGYTFNQQIRTYDMNQKVSFSNFGDLNKRVTNVSYQQNSLVFQCGFSYQF